MNPAECKERLASIGILFEQGLTDDELANIESEYGFRFPADLRQFLSYALPVSGGWLDWRNASKEEIMQRMACALISSTANFGSSLGAMPLSNVDDLI